MKMICNKAKTCSHSDCECIVPHEHAWCCDDPAHTCWADKMCECVPVKPKRKPVTVWRVTIDVKTRWQARHIAFAMRHGNSDCAKVRGPVKVALP